MKSKKRMITAILGQCFVLFCGTGVLCAMPSYNDVLLIVRTGNAGSEDVAAYYQNARHLPAANVFRPTGINATSDPNNPMSMADRDSLAEQISSYLETTGLSETINYIVLSYGFPQRAIDSPIYSTWYSQLEIFLMYRLAGNKYPFVTDNPYGFLKNANFTNREDIVFSKKKYGYYIVHRVSGINPTFTKRMIDSSGSSCFDTWKDGIKVVNESFLLPIYSSCKNELLARGASWFDWDESTQGPIHNISNINFAFLNWVATRGDEINTYDNFWKCLKFKPGSLVAVHRSYPMDMIRSYVGGLYSWSAGVETSCANRGQAEYPAPLTQNSIAIDTGNHRIWTALGLNPSWLVYTGITVDSEDFRGSGVAVYDKTGKLVTNYTKQSTGGGLISDAVYEVRYDPYNRRMWVGTFRGLCYYNFDTSSWARIPGLSELSDCAPVNDIYVDPTTSGRYIYVTFRKLVSTVKPLNAYWLLINEFDTVTGAIRTFTIDTGYHYSASMAKTTPNALWVVSCDKPGTPQTNRLSKINTATGDVEQRIFLNAIDGTNFTGGISLDRFNYRISAANVEGNNYVYIPVCSKDAGKQFNGILRINDQGTTYTRDFFGSSVWYAGDGSDGGSEKAFATFLDPNNPGDVYLITRGYDFDALSGMGKVIKFNYATPSGVELKNYASSLKYNINRATFDDEVPGKIWYVKTRVPGATHQSIMDFFPDGLATGLGGASHETWTYGGSALSSPPAVDTDLISSADPDYALYNTGIYPNTTDIAFQITIRLLDGVSMAEARYGVVRHIPTHSGTGFYGHQFIMDPKMTPYCPRADFTASDTAFTSVAGELSASIKIFSPTVRPDRNTFLASTINTTTVFLTNSIGAAIPLTSITYSSSANTITVTVDAGIPNGSYGLVLKGGRTGIKNSMGAVIVNTSPTEFSDDVSIPLTKGTVADTSPPTVTAFTIPAFSASLSFSVSSFTANDNLAVTGYLITGSSTVPSTGAAGWTSSAPVAFTALAAGVHTLYPWAKDAAGNVSAVFATPRTITITLADSVAPTVTAFTIPATATSLSFPVITFNANDNVAVTGYTITESATAPSAGAASWNATSWTTYTASVTGAHTLYPWAKDAAGNVSAVFATPRTITVTKIAPKILDATALSSPVTGTVDMTVSLEPTSAAYDLRYSYRPALFASGWLPIEGAAFSGQTNAHLKPNASGRWIIRNVNTSIRYDIKIESGVDGCYDQSYVIDSIDLTKMFSLKTNLNDAVAINSPYHGGDGITFVNLAPDTAVAIYTISGKLIVRLPAESTSAGRLVWNVKMNDGRKAGPGVYLCVLSTPRESKTLKVMVAQ